MEDGNSGLGMGLDFVASKTTACITLLVAKSPGKDCYLPRPFCGPHAGGVWGVESPQNFNIAQSWLGHIDKNHRRPQFDQCGVIIPAKSILGWRLLR
jgi:hypothetical protein